MCNPKEVRCGGGRDGEEGGGGGGEVTGFILDGIALTNNEIFSLPEIVLG